MSLEILERQWRWAKQTGDKVKAEACIEASKWYAKFRCTMPKWALDAGVKPEKPCGPPVTANGVLIECHCGEPGEHYTKEGELIPRPFPTTSPT